MSSVAQRLHEAAQRLAIVTETPRLDAELLMAHAAGMSRSRLLACLREELAVPRFEEFVQRRLGCEPIAYISGEWEFFSLEFIVEKPLLVPRPETEHLVEAALAHFKKSPKPAPRILDLGTGTGCVAIALGKNIPGAHITATDLNPAALAVARKNALRHGVAVELREGDLFSPLGAEETFDAIVSNPPYVESVEWNALSPVIRLHEDPRALLGGPDGLEVIRRLILQAPQHLVPGGLLAIEIGERQRDAVSLLLERAGFVDIHFVNDLAGISRIACGTHGAA